MKEDTFNWLWKQIETDIESIGREFNLGASNQYNFRLTYGKHTKNVIKKEYDKIRVELKNKCYSSEVNEEGDLNLIDQHKIAACLCKVFINKKVFSFDLKKETPAKLVLSNYKLAYHVSMRIIFIYLLDYYLDPKLELEEEQKKSCLKDLCQRGKLRVPKTARSHDPYNFGRIKTLALNDYYGHEVDLLMYADMMYWIEHYNKLILEKRLIMKKDEKIQTYSK